MLTANNSEGQRIEAKTANRHSVFYCPLCRCQVMLKQGAVKCAHFAHHPDSLCALSTGESARHREMKFQISSLFKDCTLERDDIVNGRRADVLTGRLVIECQISSISIGEWEQRTADYNRAGYSVLWVWDLARVAGAGENDLDGIDPTSEYRVKEEVRHAHKLCYGRLYVLDRKGQLAGCHLASAGPRYNESGPDWPDTIRYPKTLKHLRTKKISKYEWRPMSGSSGLRVAELGEGVWWK